MDTKTKYKPSGFILVEVIVSISILTSAVAAALTVASKSVFLASYSKDQIIATYLAQEGLEILRNKRDENMLSGLPWTTNIWTSECKAGINKCRVDLGWGVSQPLIEKCTGGCSFVLDRNLSTGVYAHVHPAGPSWVVTKFSRSVQTSNVSGGGSPNEMRVTSVVTYRAGGIMKTVTMTENLTSWIQ